MDCLLAPNCSRPDGSLPRGRMPAPRVRPGSQPFSSLPRRPGPDRARTALQRPSPEPHRAAGIAARVPAVTGRGSRATRRPTADRTRERLSRQLARVTPAMTGAAVAPGILSLMLAVHGKRRCFVALRHIAETCGRGVVPAAFARLRADRGRLAFPHFGNRPRRPPPRRTAPSSRTPVLHLPEPHADRTPALLRRPLATPLSAIVKQGGTCRV
jgi:hypothetical protein